MKRIRIAAALLAACLLAGCAPKRTVTVETVTTTASFVETTTTTTDEALTTVSDADGTTTVSTVGETTSKKTTVRRGTTTTIRKTTIKATTTRATTTTTKKPSPAVSEEMRGAWVSYIELAELFQSCKTPTQAKTAVDTMMKRLKDNRINTVFFHVRANSDAYYKSSIFKAATSVSKLIAAGFDPLGYAVESAHRHGMELHAWVNPYRVGSNTAYLVSDVPTLSDGSKKYYVPTSKAAQTLILNGIREILNNYAVDGIQYDDYFYPEDLLAASTVYSYESADYEDYKKGGGKLSVADWRRAGVDALIAGTHTLTSAKGVVFGVSPAVNADKTYNSLYADCRKWLAQPGYVDYLCPQIYTGFEHGGSPFDKMVTTWMNYPRHSSVKLYVGVALYKIGLKSDTFAGKGKTEWLNNSDVMKRSVLYLREKEIKGFAFYSYSYFDPASKSGLSSTADVAVAKKEIENLLDVL